MPMGFSLPACAARRNLDRISSVGDGVDLLPPSVWHLMSPRLWRMRASCLSRTAAGRGENLRGGVPLLVHAGEQYLAHERLNGMSVAYA